MFVGQQLVVLQSSDNNTWSDLYFGPYAPFSLSAFQPPIDKKRG
jgi:hypothetical protein